MPNWFEGDHLMTQEELDKLEFEQTGKITKIEPVKKGKKFKKRRDWVEIGEDMNPTRDIRNTRGILRRQFYSKHRISHNDLMNIIKDYSGYNKYEIDDILYYAAIAIAEIIATGRAVHFRGVGYFTPRKRKPFKLRSAFQHGRVHLAKPKTSINCRADTFMKNMLNLPEDYLKSLIELPREKHKGFVRKFIDIYNTEDAEMEYENEDEIVPSEIIADSELELMNEGANTDSVKDFEEDE